MAESKYESWIKRTLRSEVWWYFVVQMICLFLIFAMGAAVLGLTANWEANGIDANVGGQEVTCAPVIEALTAQASNQRCIGECLLTYGDICVPSLFGSSVRCLVPGKGTGSVDGPALGCCLSHCVDPTAACL